MTFEERCDQLFVKYMGETVGDNWKNLYEFNAYDLRKVFIAAIKTGRREGLREAAEIADNVKYSYGSPSEGENAALDAYEAIRAKMEDK